jgi:hypothetical protein
VLGAVLIIVAMALVFPPLVFGGGLVLSALLGTLLSADEADEADETEPRVDTAAGAGLSPAER